MRRETAWLGGLEFVQVLASPGTAALIGVLDAGALAERPFTVMRTRGQIFGRSDQEAASQNWGVAFGMAVVTEQAAAIGVTAVPTPVTDDDSDAWFTYEWILGTLGFVTGTGVFEEGRMIPIDSRGARKVEDSDQLIVVVEAGLLITDGVAIHGFIRNLIKLH